MIKDVEPLLKECEETLAELKKIGNMEVACYVQGFINSINKLPDAEQRPHGKWIPCSERLPEDGRPVLIYAWNVHHVVARYGQFITEDGGYKNAWVTAGAWFDNTEIRHKVIAWMPLPEPYKGCEAE